MNAFLDRALAEPNAQAKGALFEQFFEAIIAREKSIEIRKNHTVGRLGSIDYIIKGDNSKIPFNKSPWVAIERKNWSQPLPPKEISHVIDLVRDGGPCMEFGILLTTSPLDPAAYQSIHDARRDGHTIIPIEKEDLRNLIKNGFYKTVEDCLERVLFERK